MNGHKFPLATSYFSEVAEYFAQELLWLDV